MSWLDKLTGAETESKAWWQSAIAWVSSHPGTTIVLGAAAVLLASCAL